MDIDHFYTKDARAVRAGLVNVLEDRQDPDNEAALTRARNGQSKVLWWDQKTSCSHAGWGLISSPGPRFKLTIFLNQHPRKPLLMGGSWPKDDPGLRDQDLTAWHLSSVRQCI